jgi:hypothetical protein
MEKKIISSMAIVVALALIAATANTTTAFAQRSDRAAQHEFVDVSGVILENDCENAGEPVELSGDVHVVSRIVADETEAHLVLHINFQGVKGEGLTTGTNYRVPGASNTIFNLHIRPDDTSFSGEGTQVISQHFVSQGQSAQDLIVKSTLHFTLNANGELTAAIENIREECR